VLGGGRGGRKLERRVRGLTQALGPVRELDVALLMLEEFLGEDDVPHTGIECLRQVIGEERRRMHAEMVRRVNRCDIEKLRRKALGIARRRDEAEPGRRRVRDPRQVQAADERAARRAERLQAAIENAAGIYLPDRLHEVRIAVKKLRYAMEIARELRGSRAVAKIRTLKRAQDLLGRMHDLEVLIARIRGIQGSPSAPTLRVSADLDRLVRRLETESRQLHGHYIASRPALLSICEFVMTLPTSRGRRASAA
jgi:CHAD domain-containing protein